MIILLFVTCITVYGLAGDVDSNGTITMVDSLMIAQYYIGLNPTPFNRNVADVNDDGFINIIDALMIAQYYVGLIPYFPTSAYKELPVNFIKQTTPEYCGPTAALMYVNYQRLHLGYSGPNTLPSQRTIYDQMRAVNPPAASGVTPENLRDGLNELMYTYTRAGSRNYTRVYQHRPTTATPQKSLQAQILLLSYFWEPSIVMIKVPTGHHFVVMMGVNENKNLINYRDPNKAPPTFLPPDEWIQLTYCGSDDIRFRSFIAQRS